MALCRRAIFRQFTLATQWPTCRVPYILEYAMAFLCLIIPLQFSHPNYRQHSRSDRNYSRKAPLRLTTRTDQHCNRDLIIMSYSRGRLGNAPCPRPGRRSYPHERDRNSPTRRCEDERHRSLDRSREESVDYYESGRGDQERGLPEWHLLHDDDEHRVRMMRDRIREHYWHDQLFTGMGTAHPAAGGSLLGPHSPPRHGRRDHEDLPQLRPLPFDYPPPRHSSLPSLEVHTRPLGDSNDAGMHHGFPSHVRHQTFDALEEDLASTESSNTSDLHPGFPSRSRSSRNEVYSEHMRSLESFNDGELHRGFPSGSQRPSPRSSSEQSDTLSNEGDDTRSELSLLQRLTPMFDALREELGSVSNENGRPPLRRELRRSTPRSSAAIVLEDYLNRSRSNAISGRNSDGRSTSGGAERDGHDPMARRRANVSTVRHELDDIAARLTLAVIAHDHPRPTPASSRAIAALSSRPITESDNRNHDGGKPTCGICLEEKQVGD